MNAPAKIEAASLHSAMALAFAEIDAAVNGKENAAFKNGGRVSKYADICSVIDAIKPALVKHSLFFTQCPRPSEHGVSIETILHHAGGESMSLGLLYVPANRQDAQGYGSALTYARRYALVTAFGVPVEDDDGNAASRGQERSGTNREVSPAPVIDDNQWAEIVQLVEATNTDAGRLCAAYKIDSLKTMTPEQFKDAKRILSDRLKEKANA